MSSILASLDMSLDDLINKKKKGPSNPDARPARAAGGRGGRGGASAGAGGAGPVRRRGSSNRRRNQPYARPRDGDFDDEEMDVEDDDDNAGKAAAKRRAVVVNKGRGKAGEKKGSIFSRLGGAKETDAGTRIIVKNLKFDIVEDDINELFGTIGKVLKTEILYDRSGRSKGIAHVWFAKRASAEKAIKQYDGRTLDDLPMQIVLDERGSSNNNNNNVRKGLFGTALANREDKDVKFKVNLGGEREGEGARENRGRGRGRGRGDGGARPSKTAEDLDNEMDTYMKDA
ncbi:TPA: hypothetical protein N0F65_011908 [Lagenidium giganteum]|uniref:RRM domain-containing protein n=1 Tax=Lagenidium giganteum TaxID=4803 RepID=A0AAV2YT82_9STRA|nr:TPA: hypothetical protein N0F65_011908 [Lagenidium giganteum]